MQTHIQTYNIICLLCVCIHSIIASEEQHFDWGNTVHFPEAVWKCKAVDILKALSKIYFSFSPKTYNGHLYSDKYITVETEAKIMMRT